MQEPELETESVEFEVKPQTPRVRLGAVGWAVAGVAVIIIASVVVVALTGSAASGSDSLAKVMPADTLLYFSMATHPDQQAHFDVVASAWRDSKGAEQIEEALNTALTYSDFDWEKDILPWLGDRAAVGVVDLGGYQPESDAPNYYRTPNIVLAVHTRDRDKSDAFLAEVRARRERDLYGNNAIFDEVYRGVSIAYVAYDSGYASYGEAYATIDDVIVVAVGGRDDLKKAIDAALDGTNLAASDPYNATMGSLPSPNVGAFYMSYDRYVDFMAAMMPTYSGFYDGIYADLEADSELSAWAEERKQQLEEQQRRQEEQLRLMREMMQAFGGLGATMIYEPSGIRFDLAMQFFPDRLPENKPA